MPSVSSVRNTQENIERMTRGKIVIHYSNELIASFSVFSGFP
jgi:hypothetical protein